MTCKESNTVSYQSVILREESQPHIHRVNGEEQHSRSFQGAFIFKQQLPDLTSRPKLGFRAVICSTLTHACTHLPPDICGQLRKAVVGRGATAVNIISACKRLSQPPGSTCHFPSKLKAGPSAKKCEDLSRRLLQDQSLGDKTSPH